MPSLDALRAKTAANPNSIGNGGTPALTTPTITPENLVQIPAAAPLDLPVMMPQRGVFPTSMVLASDRSDSTRVFRGPNTRSAVFQTSQQPTATSVVTAATTSAVAAVLDILVNNQPVPNQSILNFVPSGGLTIAAGEDGQIIFTAPESGGDGLTHGTLPWESDPGYVSLRDDFHAIGNNSQSGGAGLSVIGELGWLFEGTFGLNSGIVGGAPPNMGMYEWANPGTINEFAYLSFPSGGSSSGSFNANTWALLENPGWHLTWVFRLNPGVSAGVPTFTTTNKAIYVGLAGGSMIANSGSTAISSARPNQFIGVRYDTSPTQTLSITSVANASASQTAYSCSGLNTNVNFYVGMIFTVTGSIAANQGTFLCTASSTTTITLNNPNGTSSAVAGTATSTGLNDSFFTLEVSTGNLDPGSPGTPAGRDNTQGSTLATSIAPTAGVWHRLDIQCSTAGVVTLTLDGSATLTANCSQQTFLTTASATGGFLTNDVGRISWASSVLQGAGISTKGVPQGAIAWGSTVTVSGLTGVLVPLNGTWSIFNAASNSFSLNLVHANIANTNAAYTLSYYPSLQPVVIFGNDNTPSPVTSNMLIDVDFFSFIWNPNLSSAPATPTITKSRYF